MFAEVFATPLKRKNYFFTISSMWKVFYKGFKTFSGSKMSQKNY